MEMSVRAEAAHFALLQRLAPSLRHRFMGILHPIALLSELAGRQVLQDPPQKERLLDTIAKLRQHARDSTTSAIDVLAWITGEEARTISLREGIEALVELIRTDSEVRGVRISHGADIEANAQVSRRALRTIVAASLIATVDLRPAVSTIRVCACVDGRIASVRIDAHHAQDAPVTDCVAEDRLFSWDDAVVLAEAERIEIRRTDVPYVILCRFPVLNA